MFCNPDAQSVGCKQVLIDIDVIQDGFAIKNTWHARDGRGQAVVGVCSRVPCPQCRHSAGHNQT